MKIKTLIATLFICAMALASCTDNNKTINDNDMETLNLTTEWDKTFPKSNNVNHSKITFHNRYGITLAADLYIPKNATGMMPAIAVCGPFEQ